MALTRILPGAEGMECAGSTLVFSRRPLGTSLAGLAALGFHQVELAVLEGWAHLAPSAVVRDPGSAVASVAEAAAPHGLEVVALNVGLGRVGPAESLRRLEAVLELAHGLGAKVATLPSPPPGGLDAETLRWWRTAVAIGTRLGVRVSVETHMGTLTEEPRQAAAFCASVEGLGLTLDPSHYVAGVAQGQGWQFLAPLVTHVHLRDARRGGWPFVQVWPGAGEVDFPGLVRLLTDCGYTGLWSIEYIDTLQVVDGPSAEAAAQRLRSLAAGWSVP